MLIALEGIDGCGKTETVSALQARLQKNGIFVNLFNKHKLRIDNAFAAKQFDGLRELIWPKIPEPDNNPMGTDHYLYLLASWHAALAKNIRDIDAFRAPITLTDGSFYRVIVKAHLRGGYPLNWLHSLFGNALTPDVVIMIDTPPELCWQRGNEFRATEIGRWDGYEGRPEASYCAYQHKVRQHLLDLATEKSWPIIKSDTSKSVEDIVDEIIPLINSEHQQEEKISAEAI